MHMDVSSWGWLWMTAMLVLWAAIFLLVVLAVARGFGPEHRADSAEPPPGILARRFANGEIGQDEHRSALSLLSSQESASVPASGAGNGRESR